MSPLSDTGQAPGWQNRQHTCRQDARRIGDGKPRSLVNALSFPAISRAQEALRP